MKIRKASLRFTVSSFIVFTAIFFLAGSLAIISCTPRFSGINDHTLNPPTALKDKPEGKSGQATEGHEDSLKTYAGSEQCIECHYQVMWGWGYTSHGKPFDDLKRQGSFNCQTCHPGREFDSRQSYSPLAIIQCECCHGPGNLHARLPMQENIRKAEEKTCTTCHSKLELQKKKGEIFLRSPFHELVFSRNKIQEGSLKRYVQNLQDRMADAGPPAKLTMALFVMSLCPYGIMAEQNILPLVKKYGDMIDFELYFIADDLAQKGDSTDRVKDETDRVKEGKESPTVEEELSYQTCTAQEESNERADREHNPINGRFQSLHGAKEIEEDIRQLIIRKYYPEKWIDYLLERNQSFLNSQGTMMDWESIAEGLGLDVAFIREKSGTEGEELFASNIKMARERKVNASPSLYLHDTLYKNRLDRYTLSQLISLISKCKTWEDLSKIAAEERIECAYDADCIVSGKIGRCSHHTSFHHF